MTHTGNFKTDYKVTVIKVVWSGQKSTYLRLMSNILSLRGTKFNSRFKGYKILFIHLYLCQENVFKMKVFITSLNKFFCQTLRATDLFNLCKNMAQNLICRASPHQTCQPKTRSCQKVTSFYNSNVNTCFHKFYRIHLELNQGMHFVRQIIKSSQN